MTLQELSEHHPYADFRRRALGILALGTGHPFPLVAQILGVTLPTPYNWLKAWHARGLVGLLNGHQGGAPAKLTAGLLDTAEQIARASPCTLAQIDRRLREIHPRCAPVQSRLPVSQPEKARFILYPNAAFVEKNAALNSSNPRGKT